MTRGFSVVVLSALLAAGIAGGVGLASKLESSSDPAVDKSDPASTLESTFNKAASIATKAVVHITISNARGADNVGSGVIVSSKGHIVTNYHVVDRDEAFLVRFVDGTEYPATVQGADPESDIALLKIEAKERSLHPIEFADSDQVRVGDIVFAVGSPFGYTHTVTSGIVSAKHRRLELEKPYEDYLQTDAAINPGNSGGALVNLKGQLVGMNSAMVSGSRTNDGVGLAIASNLVKWVKDRLIRDGEVRRGMLGIKILEFDFKALAAFKLLDRPDLAGAETTEEVAKRLGLAEPGGAVVFQVGLRSPAAAVALKQLDVITEFDGRPVRSVHELVLRVVELEPGTKVKLKYVRNRKVEEATVTLARRNPLPALGGNSNSR